MEKERFGVTAAKIAGEHLRGLGISRLSRIDIRATSSRRSMAYLAAWSSCGLRGKKCIGFPLYGKPSHPVRQEYYRSDESKCNKMKCLEH